MQIEDTRRLSGSTRAQLLNDLMSASRLGLAHSPDPLRPASAPPPSLPRSSETFPLPDPASPIIGLEEALAIRRAERSYGDEPLTTQQLSSLLLAAEAMDASGWPGERRAQLDLEILCVVSGVAGLSPGFYAFHPQEHVLRSVATLPGQGIDGTLVLQHEFAAAPVILTIVGPLARALTVHGAHGHRLLLVRAGATAHAMWLAGLALGLVGTVFAGLLPEVLREHVGVDGYLRAPLFAVALGRPPVRIGPSLSPDFGKGGEK